MKWIAKHKHKVAIKAKEVTTKRMIKILNQVITVYTVSKVTQQ